VSTLVVIDGVTHAPEHAKVSVFDRGFLYGDAVFETLRTYGGEPFALDEHLERLEWSAGRVFITPPVTRAVLRDEVLAALAAAGNAESIVRVMVTRGSGELGLDPDLADRPTRVVIVAPLKTPSAEAYAQGVGVVTFRTQRVADATDAAGAKIANYLIAVLATREARRAGAVEALIVDQQGQVVEGTSSNVFAVRGGRLLTPPEDLGILPGITRARVLDGAGALGIPVELTALSASELASCDEVFISSTLREILPVVRIDAAVVGTGSPGPVTLRLLEQFRARTRAGSRSSKTGKQ
jgi:branched-chain amino acid aminotransferase